MPIVRDTVPAMGLDWGSFDVSSILGKAIDTASNLLTTKAPVVTVQQPVLPQSPVTAQPYSYLPSSTAGKVGMGMGTIALLAGAAVLAYILFKKK